MPGQLGVHGSNASAVPSSIHEDTQGQQARRRAKTRIGTIAGWEVSLSRSCAGPKLAYTHLLPPEVTEKTGAAQTEGPSENVQRRASGRACSWLGVVVFAAHAGSYRHGLQ